MVMPCVIGDRVWYRSRHVNEYTLRGVIECRRTAAVTDWGVRLENGGFEWVTEDQIKSRRDEPCLPSL